MVLFAHSLSFFFGRSRLDLNAAYYAMGFLGVELFFTLSGFLIGKILLEDVLRDCSWKSLHRFYVRRWLRTLPPYYLVLLLLPLTGRSFNWNSLAFLTSYAAYLLHLEIFDFFAPHASAATGSSGVFLLVALALTVTMLLSAAMHRWYETPILRFRDRAAPAHAGPGVG